MFIIRIGRMHVILCVRHVLSMMSLRTETSSLVISGTDVEMAVVTLNLILSMRELIAMVVA